MARTATALDDEWAALSAGDHAREALDGWQDENSELAARAFFQALLPRAHAAGGRRPVRRPAAFEELVSLAWERLRLTVPERALAWGPAPVLRGRERIRERDRE